MAGLTGNTLLVASSIQFVINVIMTIPALLFVDRWGRRPTLLIGALLMATWLFADGGILASYGTYRPDGINGTKEASMEVKGAASKAVIACSYLFVASFAPTRGPVSWIYPPELYPLRVRGKAVALSTSANWAFNFALGYFVPPGLSLPTPSIFWFAVVRNVTDMLLYSIRQHPMEDVHRLRRLLHRHVRQRLLHVPGDGG